MARPRPLVAASGRARERPLLVAEHDVTIVRCVRHEERGEASDHEEIVGTEVVEALVDPGEPFRMQGLGTLGCVE